MKDEIKEILDKLNENKDYDDYVDYKGSYFKPLLDYITNLQKGYDNAVKQSIVDHKDEAIVLQEENKKLKHKLEQMYNDTKDTYNKICAEQIDYKSRNEKAIEYVRTHYLKPTEPELENILNGGDE